MPDTIQVKHETWSSGYKFILATIGAAIGLANIWRFPYVTGTSGGSTFVLAYDAIVEAGNPFDMLVSGLSWSKSLEAGLMVFSMGTRDERMNPLEHWRTNLVDLDKEPFIGRAALEKITAEGGPSRKIIGLAGGAEPLSRIERPCRIKYQDKDIGVTRALAFSPSLQRNICLALVERKYIDKGLKLVVEHPDRMVGMAVTELPFVDKDGLRVRS